MFGEECVLYENKICDECGDCNFCDIDPNKICDNCGKCIENDGYEYAGIEIDDVLELEEKSEADADCSHDNHKDCCCGHDHDI